jgi:CIC family chloride channel protein
MNLQEMDLMADEYLAFPQSSADSRFHILVKRWRRHLTQWLDRREVSESLVILLTALVVGVGAGLGAVVFRRLIAGMQTLAYDGLGGLLEGISPFHLLIIPALGGAIYGPMIYRFAREAKGHGVPEVMEAVALRGGRIRPRVAVIKSLASSICIGVGGSVGREGPIAQIGSALGSTVGQALKLSDERVRNLVACGAAGGIAATFNAPIAGSIFALEVILGQLHTFYFGAVVISAVTADVIAHIFEGDLRAFVVPEYTLVSPWELVLYTLLGGLAALAAVAFTRLLYLSEDLWDELPVAEYLKPVLGGALLGVIGILTFKIDGFPRVFGVGYDSIGQALFGQFAIRVTLALFFFKLLATILTLGAGGSGGVFAPSLFMGAMLGEAFGQMMHQLFPTITAPAGAYALVGMAAMFSGAAHAPVTAILILFEMTGNYLIILPLMLATVVSTVISRIISRESIYTLKLSRRGVHLEQGRDIDVMQGVTVGEAMTTDLDVVPLSMSLEELSDEFARTHHHGFPVLNDKGELAGVVSIRDLERALATGPIEGQTVADIAATENLILAYPNEPMWVALRRLGARDLSRLPVVEEEGSRTLVGIVRRADIIRAYNQAIIKRAHHQHRAETLRLGKLDSTAFVHVEIPAGSPIVGQRISEIQLPEECLIVSVRRGRKLHVAHGYTVIQAADQVTVFAAEEYALLVRQRLTGESVEIPAQDEHKARHREFTIPAGAACSGRPVQELALPPDCILVSIRRGDEVLIPHGDTLLQAGDVVEIFGLEEELSAAQSCLSR